MANKPFAIPPVRPLSATSALGTPPPPGPLPWEPMCAVFRKYLRGQKLKFTPERAMMLDAVLRKQGRFDPEQLAEDLKSLGHTVSRATLYRTLTHLMDAGILRQVFFENRKVYYEVIAGRQPYDHLICIESGNIIEFSSEQVQALCKEICRQHGWQFISHHLQILGVAPAGGPKK
jgi:Fur family transcriptional regulator, ferric uptake regulator